ncbi:KOW motif domain-containing protein [Decorospora gaudefroyi]|uniref:KOW motif domain-containing protein n=1 Tax=Decorospora gaudefroyi TaxID=184978 RepID=A0A6A5KZ43_9PLEO|nr:KOW motif domain-containing protein [Decorospora gaudefroyi]
MNQLVATPGRNAARQAKRLKEIRKVKYAIKWHERARKKRQELQQQRWESKQSVLQRLGWEHENIHQVRKKALANAEEDWKLGPLRPNRAFGPSADKYGALTPDQVSKPEIPVVLQKNRNEYRQKKGLELEYPLVVDDKRYFPIVKGDRVVVLKGKAAGKVGTVGNIFPRTHEVVVKNLNKQYYDTDVFQAVGGDVEPTREQEVPIPLSEVRLVVPSVFAEGGSQRYQDVIVDKILMKRHTTGIDPYTGTDYGDAEIPEAHQYDPRNGLPIFYRYIAGTQHRIEWPWEREEDSEDVGEKEEATGKNYETRFRKAANLIKHPITSLARFRGKENKSSDKKSKDITDAAALESEIASMEDKAAQKWKEENPRAPEPKIPNFHNGVDATRNDVEDISDPMRYTLVAPPFPDTLGEELRSHIRQFSVEAKKNKDPDYPRLLDIEVETERTVLAAEVAKQRQRAADAMKTPMQLRWELEHRKKVEMRNKQPLVDEETLLAALGQHMLKTKKQPYLGKKQFSVQTEVLD